jgi:hypothetical protein
MSRKYPVIGIITVSPITDIAFIETAFIDRTIGAMILDPNSYNVFPELYASAYKIPVYFIRSASPIYLTAVDEVHIFCRSIDDVPTIMDECDAAHVHVELHMIP